jgi:hypothetical protein
MGKGPKGQRRPADLNKRAFAIVQIAAGDDSDPTEEPRGRAGGLAGGKARADRLNKEAKANIAKKAAAARWKPKP